MSATPPANWYPDPDDPGQLRYWDGTQWTDHRVPGSGSGVATPPAATAPAAAASPASSSDTSAWPTPWQPDEPAPPAAQPYLTQQPYPYAVARSSGLALASVIVAALSVPAAVIVIGGIGGVVAIVLGILGLRQVNASAGTVTGRGMAITGIVVGAVAVVGALLVVYVVVALDRAIQQGWGL